MSILQPENPIDKKNSSLSDIDTLSSDTRKDIFHALTSKNTIKETVLRVYLLRHYPYVDTPEWREYEACLKKRKEIEGNDIKVKENNKKIELLGTLIQIIPEFDQLPEEVKTIYSTIFSNPSKTALFFDFNKQGRAQATGKDIRKNFPEIGFVESVNLPGSNKTDERGLSDADKVAEMKKALQDAFVASQGNYETIVIIGNRSYAEGFDVLKSQRERTHEDNESLFEDTSYLLMDYTDMTLEKPLKSGGLQIEITTHNMMDIIAVINEVEGHKIIQINSPQGVQNQINTLFYYNLKLFAKYLVHPNSPIELQTFCLMYLMEYEKPENEELLQQYVFRFKEQKIPLPIETIEVFLRYINTSLISKEALFISILSANAGQKKDIYMLCKKWKQESVFSSLDNLTEIILESNNRAENIFKYSLDDAIKNPDNRNLIIRGLHALVNWTEKRIETMEMNLSDTEKNIYQNHRTRLNDIIFPSPYNSFALMANVGDGKSTELAKMHKAIDVNFEYQDFISLFYTAKDNSKDIVGKIKGDIRVLSESFPGKKIVIFFDGMDELDVVTRTGVVLFFKNLTKQNRELRLIMGSRPSGFENFSDADNKIIKLYFDEIKIEQRNEFLLSRLQGLGVKSDQIDIKIKEINTFFARNILQQSLCNTPLILLFLCILSVGDKDTGWTLHAITNRADLYEKIVYLILAKHQGNTDNKNSKLNDAHKYLLFDTLGYLAYKKNKNNEHIEKQDILSYLQKKHDIESISTQNQVLDQIFLLYKTGEGGYEFILKSFDEYFLARYLTTIDNEDKKILNEESRALISFYTDILINNGDIDGLIELLEIKYLIRGKFYVDEISTIKHMLKGAEILYLLPENVKNDPRIIEVKNLYVEKINEIIAKNLNRNIIASNIKHLILEFMESINYIDTDISHNILLILLSQLNAELVVAEREKLHYFNVSISQDNLLHIAQIGTPEAISLILDWTKFIGKNPKFYHKYHDEFLDIWRTIAEIGTMDSIKGILTCAEILMEKRETSGMSGEIYNLLTKKQGAEIIQRTIECVELLFEEGKIFEASQAYRVLVQDRIKEAAKGALKCADILAEEEGVYFWILEFYQNLIFIGVQEAISSALKCADILMNKNKFYKLGEFYRYILLIDIPQIYKLQAKEGILKFSGKLVEKGHFSQIADVYESLLNPPSASFWHMKLQNEDI